MEGVSEEMKEICLLCKKPLGKKRYKKTVCDKGAMRVVDVCSVLCRDRKMKTWGGTGGEK